MIIIKGDKIIQTQLKDYAKYLEFGGVIMTEDEYILVEQLTQIRAMQAILRNILPGAGVVPKNEYIIIGKILYGWAKNINNSLKVD